MALGICVKWDEGGIAFDASLSPKRNWASEVHCVTKKLLKK